MLNYWTELRSEMRSITGLDMLQDYYTIMILNRYPPTSDLFKDLDNSISCGRSQKQKEGNGKDIVQFINESLWSTMIAGLYK